MALNIICALTRDGAIGLRGGLLYHLPADLRHFKALTTGHTVIMGRKTYESLPKGALPNRRNIVLTRQAGYTAPGIEVAHSLDEALNLAQTDSEVYIIGGHSLYAAALPLADRLCLTLIDDVPAEADTYFPELDLAQWQLTSEERHERESEARPAFTFADYVRRQA